MRLVLAALLAMIAVPASALDYHSYARYDQVRVAQLALDLDVSFEHKTLQGFAEYRLQWLDPKARTLDLDTRALSIERVVYAPSAGEWKAARFVLAANDRVMGSKLSITLPSQSERVRVYYRTSPQAVGLQWLEPAQTLGKRTPFMFSQSESIQARSWVPLQDTPAVRFTYRAHITAPTGLRVVMSANNDAAATGVGGYRFTMPQPIPSYLLAIAVGDLQFRPLGTRAGVYAEPERVEAAAKEFDDTERMIATTEALYGPYRWGRYDILVLPPSFPFGGMENPRVTFATPTIIAGDKSLVALIAHELAHSWSGNLVTNATWPHFWLNESFTTYVENRIVEALYGPEQALMQQRIDQIELIEEMKTLTPNDQQLVPDMRGRDPDDAYSGVPYAKGAWMLRTMEQRVGRAAFDPFLRGWFDDHAFQSADTDMFVAYLHEHLLKSHPEAIGDEELRSWLYQPGIPASAKMAQTTRLDAVDAARVAWQERKTDATAIGASKWTTQEWQHFLNGLPSDLSADRLAELDSVYHLTASGNSEIAMRWFLAGIRANYQPIREPLHAYLLSIGRRKLVVPLYEALGKSATSRQWGLDTFAQARPGYHPMTAGSVAQVLGVK